MSPKLLLIALVLGAIALVGILIGVGVWGDDVPSIPGDRQEVVSE